MANLDKENSRSDIATAIWSRKTYHTNFDNQTVRTNRTNIEIRGKSELDRKNVSQELCRQRSSRSELALHKAEWGLVPLKSCRNSQINRLTTKSQLTNITPINKQYSVKSLPPSAKNSVKINSEVSNEKTFNTQATINTTVGNAGSISPCSPRLRNNFHSLKTPTEATLDDLDGFAEPVQDKGKEERGQIAGKKFEYDTPNRLRKQVCNSVDVENHKKGTAIGISLRRSRCQSGGTFQSRLHTYRKSSRHERLSSLQESRASRQKTAPTSRNRTNDKAKTTREILKRIREQYASDPELERAPSNGSDGKGVAFEFIV